MFILWIIVTLRNAVLGESMAALKMLEMNANGLIRSWAYFKDLSA